MKIDKLPVRTWEKLNVNETTITDVTVSACEYSQELPVGVGHYSLHNSNERADGTKGITSSGQSADINAGTDIFADIRTGLGDEFDDALDKNAIPVNIYKITSGIDNKKPVYQDFEVAGDGGANVLYFDVADGSSCTVIQFITSKVDITTSRASDAPAESVDITTKYALQNKYHIGKGASLTLIQVQNLSPDTELYNGCGGVCEDGASFHRIQLILGGGVTYTGDFCALLGSKSIYTCDIGYRLTGTHTLDMNYIADHNGRSSESRIKVSGVMENEAEKVFRGTIDFHRGCAGSKGSELEEVLLLDDTIVNKTVPLILCDEEDVEGSHGATIGQLDENLLFYLKSRGIEEDEIYSMMTRARIDAVAGLIEDESARKRVDTIIGKTAG